MTSMGPSVRDILNESFHEHRPSFRTLLTTWEKGSKGSFYTTATNPTLVKAMQKQKDIRLKEKQMAASSFASSVSSLNLDLIDEDSDNMEEEESEHVEESENVEESKHVKEMPIDSMNTTEENDKSESLEDVLTDALHLDNAASISDESDQTPEKKKRRKKRAPKFATEEFESVYKLGKELGAGAYAVVKEGEHRKTGESYAIKIIDTQMMDQGDLDALQIEISVMSKLKHPNIIRLYETYIERNNYYLVTEKMVGGELLDRVVQKTYYNEKEARDTCLILFSAMRYCHSKRIAHRDLKPENLLLQSNDSDSDIKIADFGFAKKVPSDGLRTMCGTPGYVAPEILERTPYGTQCDMWGLGVIVYILLGGYSPFEEKSQDLLFDKIRAGEYEFHPEFWDPVSSDAKDFIRRLLTVNPRKRMTAAQSLQHKWMTCADEVLECTDLGANLTELKKFNAKRKFKAAVKTVIATQKLTSMFGC